MVGSTARPFIKHSRLLCTSSINPVIWRKILKLLSSSTLQSTNNAQNKCKYLTLLVPWKDGSTVFSIDLLINAPFHHARATKHKISRKNKAGKKVAHWMFKYIASLHIFTWLCFDSEARRYTQQYHILEFLIFLSTVKRHVLLLAAGTRSFDTVLLLSRYSTECSFEF